MLPSALNLLNVFLHTEKVNFIMFNILYISSGKCIWSVRYFSKKGKKFVITFLSTPKWASQSLLEERSVPPRAQE